MRKQIEIDEKHFLAMSAAMQRYIDACARVHGRESEEFKNRGEAHDTFRAAWRDGLIKDAAT